MASQDGRSKAGYINIQNFRFGLDARRSELTSQPGTLLRAVDCHVNQGAELEKRKAIVKTGFPASTFPGLPTLTTQLVFGSIDDPGMPAGFTYQQLTSPLGAAMTVLNGATLFNNEAFVIATFGVDGTFCFYNGTLVGDFTAGLVLTGLTSTAQQATNLAALIHGFFLSGTIAYDAVAVGSVVTITDPSGGNFTGVDTLTTANSGAIALQQDSTGIPGSTATSPVASFTITAARFSGIGLGPYIAGIYLPGSVNLTATNVFYGGAINTLALLATAIATGINNYTGSNGGFTAIAAGATVDIYGPTGTSYNSVNILVASVVSSDGTGSITLGTNCYVFTAPVSSTLVIASVAIADNAVIDTAVPLFDHTASYAPGGGIALASYASLNLFLQAVATGIMASFGATGGVSPVLAAAIGNNLYISFSSDASYFPAVAVTITYTATNGATVSGTAAMSVSLAVNTFIGNLASSVTVTPKNGTGPFTYVWTSSNAQFAITNGTTATVGVNFIGQLPSLGQPSTVITCTVTDSTGQTASKTLTIYS